ncbi:hypothetical protein ANN_19705 [Periplaneta americana]|uniref:Uncharacterized protein n=1 Tax=Periplaneta americana TaxID=6978 RepID=A0ABQ8SAU0_PERAM|nr:hypothetical protein ANN_19705 [Periplaneta americana]
MAGLCEGGNEPPGSLVLKEWRRDEERTTRKIPTNLALFTTNRSRQSPDLNSDPRSSLRDFGPDKAVQWEIRITAY